MTDQVKTNWVELVLHANVPTGTMKHVLLTIAALANENGRCRPSIARLAILTGLDRRTIIRNLKKLEEVHWLYINRPGTKANNETNFYMLSERKCRIDTVNLTPCTKKYSRNKVEAHDPIGRGAEPPNNTIPAPRPTAAPQAQAGGSGAGINVIEDLVSDTDPLFWDFSDDDKEKKASQADSSEPEFNIGQPVAPENPFEGRANITLAEFDRAYELGISPFDLPDDRDESI